jgi:GntR family transcriptional regulator / MocR family aminotransferase
MRDLNVRLDPEIGVGLQLQLRRWLVDAIASGVLRPGRRLPSSRSFARRAGISRNTVVLAYAALLAEGYLESRARSGIFVAQDVSSCRLAVRVKRSLPRPLAGVARRLEEGAEWRRLPNWHRYPYSFVDGHVDPQLLPTSEWREATRLVFSRHEARSWGIIPEGADDPLLVEELRTKVLPSRGINALADEILVAQSARQVLPSIVDLLAQRGTPVYCPQADPELLGPLRERQAQLLGAEAAERALPEGTVVFTCPARSLPTGMVAGRRGQKPPTLASGGAIVEYDLPPDIVPEQSAALVRALDNGGRSIFLTSLSQFATAGLPLAVVFADRAFVRDLRRLRYQLGLAVPIAHQRAWGHFIGLGHYAAVLARASKVLRERRTELRDALNYYMRKSVVIETSPGASAYWVRGAKGLDAMELAAKAAAAGILIEPGPDLHGNVFRMGVSGIESGRIRPGVQLLADLLRCEPAQIPRRLSEDAFPPLRGLELQRMMSGAVLLYTTVYGDPCTIEIHPDGTLVGRAGHHNEDCDRGSWWIDGGRWYRQWRNWVYGERTGFDIVVEGRQMRWYGGDGLLADTAVIAEGTLGRSARRPE